MSELTILSNDCEFDVLADTTSIADWADRVIDEKICAHVAKAELLPNDGRAYAVLGARCYDKTKNAYRCSKRTSDKLFLLAWRFSNNTRTLKGKMTIDGTPKDFVHIKGKSGEIGSHIIEEFVLHPSSSQDPVPDWRASYEIVFIQSKQPVPASIDISFEVKLDKPKWKLADSLGLAVTVPPLLAPFTTIDPTLTQLSRKESTRAMDGMTALVVSESVKLLLKDGWDFIKKIATDGPAKNDELVQLNIGKLAVPAESSAELVDKSVRELDIMMPQLQLDELHGLNNQLRGLSTYRKNLRSNLLDALTRAEKADLETKIERTSDEMIGVQQEIWKILQETGNFSLTTKDLRAG